MHFFFFNDTATTEIYTLSLHDALPICKFNLPFEIATNDKLEAARTGNWFRENSLCIARLRSEGTRLNSSHLVISYAVFCLKKKNTNKIISTIATIELIYTPVHANAAHP